jgi:hypothetical protein
MGQNIVKGATKGFRCEIMSCKIKDYLLFLSFETMVIMTYFNTHEFQETQIKNPFYPILSFYLVKD